MALMMSFTELGGMPSGAPSGAVDVLLASVVSHWDTLDTCLYSPIR